MNETSGWSPEPGEKDRRHDRESLTGLLGRLANDARAYAQAEINRQKVLGRFIATNVVAILLIGVITLFLLFGLLVATLLGTMWVLEPMLGRGLAVVATLGGTLAAILLCTLIARSRVKRLKSLKGKRP